MSRLLVAGILLAAASMASAATIIQDDFESYTDQASFEAVWPTVTAPTPDPNNGPGIWSTDQSYSPTHSVYFPKTPKKYNNYRNFSETAGTDAQPLEWSFRFYDSVIAANRNYGQLYDNVDPNGTAALSQLIAMGVYNTAPAQSNTYYSARVAFLAGGTAPGWFLLNDLGAATRTVGWHELKAVIKTSTIDFYVDGILSKANVPYRQGTTVLSFDQVRLNSGLTSSNIAYVDDVLIQTTPEPAAFGLFVLGLALLRRR